MHGISDPQKKNKTQQENERQKSENETFWTVCPYCYYMYEYDGFFKECCLRCQHCKKPFHGVSVAPPQVGMVVEGKEQYYCGIGYFPLKYELGGFLSDKKRESGGSGESFLGEKKEKNENFVLISDDSDDDDGRDSGLREEIKTEKECGFRFEGEMVKNASVGQEGTFVQGSVRTEVEDVKNSESTKVGVDGMMVSKKVKSVARNTKKVVGRGKKVMMVDSSGNQGNRVEVVDDMSGEFGEEDEVVTGSKEGSSEGELEVFVGEDDIFVGFNTDY